MPNQQRIKIIKRVEREIESSIHSATVITKQEDPEKVSVRNLKRWVEEFRRKQIDDTRRLQNVFAKSILNEAG